MSTWVEMNFSFLIHFHLILLTWCFISNYRRGYVLTKCIVCSMFRYTFFCSFSTRILSIGLPSKSSTTQCTPTIIRLTQECSLALIGANFGFLAELRPGVRCLPLQEFDRKIYLIWGDKGRRKMDRQRWLWENKNQQCIKTMTFKLKIS